MKKLTREDLMSLEQYAEQRPEFRKKVIEHKIDRHIALGEHATLYFEDYLTVQYQVQEMLRIEKIFEAGGINEELEAYNPLIPDGKNFKATFMIEYADVEERQQKLAKLVGVEDKVWVKVNGFDKVFAIANEDLERSTAEKTSAVHFMRFELSSDMAKAVKDNQSIAMGIDYSGFDQLLDPINENSRLSLMKDIE